LLVILSCDFIVIQPFMALNGLMCRKETTHLSLKHSPKIKTTVTEVKEMSGWFVIV